MKTIHTPFQRNGTVIYLDGNAGGFDVKGCPNALLLAETIQVACNSHDNLVAQVEQLRDDLNDARTGLEAATEELRQADAIRDQLVAALRSARHRCTAWNDQAGGGAIDAALKAAGVGL